MLIYNKEELRKRARTSFYNHSLKPMTAKELLDRAKKANKDIAAGRLTTSEELEKEIKNW